MRPANDCKTTPGTTEAGKTVRVGESKIRSGGLTHTEIMKTVGTFEAKTYHLVILDNVVIYDNILT